MDPGSEKKTDAELELNTAENLKEDDNESVGVTSEVADSTKDVDGKEVDSPYPDLVKVGSSFVYTVDRNKVDKNKNITKILAIVSQSLPYLPSILGMSFTFFSSILSRTLSSLRVSQSSKVLISFSESILPLQNLPRMMF